MLISIIVATFNSGKTLEKCLLSVFNQSYKNFEILVKDGGSKDNTLEIISNYKSKFSFFSVGSDDGVYDAWNICLENCKGDWIIFLGSDDYFTSSNFLLEMQPYFIQGESKNARIIHGMNQIVDDNGREVMILGNDISRESCLFYEKMPIRHPGCFHHKSLFSEVGLFDTNFKIIGDYQFILRALKFTNFLFYPFVGVIHTNGGISTNPTYVSKIIRENVNMRRQLNIKPFFNLNLDMCKRISILIIVNLFGYSYGIRIVNLISRLKN